MMLRRTPLTRKNPLKASAGLTRTAFKRRAPKKRPGYHEPKYLAACRGEPCYLQIPGVCRGERDTVVPCHANWSDYGKGLGLKVCDSLTFPLSPELHHEHDRGGMPRAERIRREWEYVDTTRAALIRRGQWTPEIEQHYQRAILPLRRMVHGEEA